MAEPVSTSMSVETPLIAEDMNKDILLRKLQNRIHFEKTVAVSEAPTYTEHAIPAWFVTEHGYKFRQSVLLWSGSSTEPWRVELHLRYRPPCSRPEAKVTGGWRAFASANGLVVGDTLFFCLRAMSELDVYIFRKTLSQIQPSSDQAPRKRSHDLELLKEKEDNSVGCRSYQNSVAEIVEDGTGTGSRLTQTLMRDRQGNIFFEKTFTAGAVSARYQLIVPTLFVQQHGDKFHKRVVLQSVADRKMWTAKVNVHFARKQPQVLIYGETWKAFVAYNGLVKGDQLTFTLVATSKFQVFIIRGGGNPKAVPNSVRGQVIRSRSSTFSQTSQTLKPLGPQHSDLTGKSSVKMERELSSELLSETENAEDSEGAYSAPGSNSRSPSDMALQYL